VIAPIQVIRKHKVDKREGLKAMVSDLLQARYEHPETPKGDQGLTLGEILRALGLGKDRNGDVTSALHKLRADGTVVHGRQGPATSTRGPRFVKRYRWNLVAEKAQSPSDDRRFNSLWK
jgi:hypothetical protein